MIQLRLSKRQSLSTTTVLFRTTFTRTIKLGRNIVGSSSVCLRVAKSLTGLKLRATTPTTLNNMQQGVQTDATCNIQQYWGLLTNNVASVCTGIYLFPGVIEREWEMTLVETSVTIETVSGLHTQPIEGCPILRQIYAWHCIVLSSHYNTVQKNNNKERSKTIRNLTKPCINLSEYWTSMNSCTVVPQDHLAFSKVMHPKQWRSFALFSCCRKKLTPIVVMAHFFTFIPA